MKCPECGYEGDEWLHDAVKRSDGWDGYFCPRCNHHLLMQHGVVRRDDDHDELAAHLVDDGTLAAEDEKMTQPYYQMLEQRLHIQGETLRKALEIVRAVAGFTDFLDCDGYFTQLQIEARALLASADERSGGDGG